MGIELTAVLFIPVVFALIGCLLPGRLAQFASIAGSALVLAHAAVLVAGFNHSAGAPALQHVTDVSWIPQLGIHWSLGVDGLNILLIALTALLWLVGTIAAARTNLDRPKLFYVMLGLAETSVLGCFMAQDLAVFVLFFDLMLVPFYFLIGAWGRGNAVAATTKLVIYTLVGSLLMLAGAIALGVLATPSGGTISFALTTLAHNPLPAGTQYWIFALFALAFLVKMPAFPFHGWMPDGYRAAPLPVLIVFSAVVSKVAAYGFLKIVLPIMPDAAAHFQTLILVLAVISIIYGSVMAFTADDTRLVLGYSSVAQLGFITLGIFSLTALGAQGALIQMVNHGLVVAALFLIIGFVAARAGGSDSLADMGGIATRAPILAALFLIAALASLAMPGSANFVGELYILFGAFSSQLVFGLVATTGVALAAVYMIRVYQRSMHNRVGPKVESRELARGDLALLAPLVLVIIALSVYPQALLAPTKEAASASVQTAGFVSGSIAPVAEAKTP
ncbi:MAG: NADH-quinone oxidoreductase subunit [Thermoleophilaceae bacterium]|nr:NADH-quinone oxidoreductase subunit [Thermoleophilaceae bacterium]